MGKRAQRLAALLRGEDLVVYERRTGERPGRGNLPDESWQLILDRYRALGGWQTSPSLIPGPWDLRVEDRLVELDEERHFNRWRAKTLESAAYDGLGPFPREDYVRLCSEREAACLRAASNRGSWSTPGSVRQFGPAGQEGVLEGLGSPRWRQRALYDFVKDVASFGPFPSLARISIWEELPGSSLIVNDVLSAGCAEANAGPALVALITSRWQSRG